MRIAEKSLLCFPPMRVVCAAVSRDMYMSPGIPFSKSHILFGFSSPSSYCTALLWSAPPLTFLIPIPRAVLLQHKLKLTLALSKCTLVIILIGWRRRLPR